MKLFQFNQKSFKAIGIDANDDSNWSWVWMLNAIGFVHNAIARGAFILFKAETIVDYGLAFYAFATSFTAGLTDLLVIWKRRNIFSIIQNFENFIEKRNLMCNFHTKVA